MSRAILEHKISYKETKRPQFRKFISQQGLLHQTSILLFINNTKH